MRKGGKNVLPGNGIPYIFNAGLLFALFLQNGEMPVCLLCWMANLHFHAELFPPVGNELSQAPSQ
jgi:hypothetical protein